MKMVSSSSCILVVLTFVQRIGGAPDVDLFPTLHSIGSGEFVEIGESLERRDGYGGGGCGDVGVEEGLELEGG